MLGRSALLAAGGESPYGNWTGNYSDVSLLLRGGTETLGPVAPLDESPTPKTLNTFGGAVISTTISRYGTASIHLPSTGSYLTAQLLSPIGTSDFTLEAWIYMTVPWGGSVGFFSFGPSEYWGIGNFGGSLSLAYNGVSAGFVLGQNFAQNTWQHIALVRQSGTAKYYVNGDLKSTFAFATNLTPTTVEIGRGVGFQHFTGYIDDFRLTVGVARYTANFTPPTAELPASATNDPSYNSVSLLLRGSSGTSTILVPVDESPTPKTLTVSSGAGISTTVFKYGSSSFVFNGTSTSRVEVSHSTQLDLASVLFTVEFYIYYTSISSLSFIVGKPSGFGSGVGWSCWSNNGRIDFGINGDYQTITSSVLIPVGQWTHVAIVDNGSTTRIYINGTSRASSSLRNTTSNTLPLSIGGASPSNWGAPYPFDGFIDDLRITKGIARYTKNFLPPPAQLPAI